MDIKKLNEKLDQMIEIDTTKLKKSLNDKQVQLDRIKDKIKNKERNHPKNIVQLMGHLKEENSKIDDTVKQCGDTVKIYIKDGKIYGEGRTWPYGKPITFELTGQDFENRWSLVQKLKSVKVAHPQVTLIKVYGFGVHADSSSEQSGFMDMYIHKESPYQYFTR